LAFARIAAIAPMIAAAATGVWPACTEKSASPGSSDFDPGPTFGAEITVTVAGRGRVTSNDGSIDCPSKCFARVLLDGPTKDGAAPSVVLVAESTFGVHFAGWKLEELPLGVRARGPAQCSPMTRMSSLVSVTTSFVSLTTPSTVIQLELGETNGTPPRGHEEECEAWKRVPVAYALTATFAEDFVDAGREAGPDAGAALLYEPPPSAVGAAAKEIGIASGFVYWRYERNGLSGIARGDTSVTDITGGPRERIDTFDVDAHVLYQTSTGLKIITAGAEFPVGLDGAPTCLALASDLTNAYCRAQDPTGPKGSTRLWRWAIDVASAPTVVYSLPPGNALAVDGQRFYFSDEQDGLTGQASIQSAPRSGGDGGAPFTTMLADNQRSPRDLAVGPWHLFWLDERGGGVFSATSASKFSTTIAQVSSSGSIVRFVAADQQLSQYWVGIRGAGTGASSILRAVPGTGSTTTFRAGLTGLGGIAVDNAFVYWTQSDGRVYRAPKNDARP
jgi:hypothetical protein